MKSMTRTVIASLVAGHGVLEFENGANVSMSASWDV
jgi:hypothetical protein